MEEKVTVLIRWSWEIQHSKLKFNFAFRNSYPSACKFTEFEVQHLCFARDFVKIFGISFFKNAYAIDSSMLQIKMRSKKLHSNMKNILQTPILISHHSADFVY